MPVRQLSCRQTSISTLHEHINGYKSLKHTLSGLRPMAQQQAAAATAAQQADIQSLSPRVLSIQSSVVHGYVGNKCAVFPLQLLGFDVDPVVSVQFSNHTGYPAIKGHVFDGKHLREILAGLKANELICHTHLLSGYIGSLSLLEAVAAVAAELRAVNPNLIYVCDPVLGDEGQLYVSQDLVTAYRNTLVPLANVITPNQFEAECLTGMQVVTERDALAAAEALHDMGPQTVIITSMTPLPHPEYSSPMCEVGHPNAQSAAAAAAAAAADGSSSTQQQQQQQYITLIASTRLPQAAGCPSNFRLRIPQLPGYFTGTGDLLSALLLAWTSKHPDNLAAAVEAAVAGLQGVLAVTAAAAGPEVLAAKNVRSAEIFKAKELRIIQGQQHLLHPKVTIRAQPL